MEKDIINKLADLYNRLDDINWDISQVKTEICILEESIENNNTIKDINNLKRELKRDGLYSDKLEEFLENYMKYYNK